jgi:hypothetical protein
MSILGNIMSSIFGGQAAPPPSQHLAGMEPAAKSASATPASSTPGPQPPAEAREAKPAAPPQAGAQVDVTAILDKFAAEADQKLDWRHSIVDLMKLLKLDSSLTARKKLAQELSYTGDMKDTAAMNIWLHKQVMQRVAQSGGKLPAELRH